MTCKHLATSLATTTALCLSLAVITSSADAAQVVLSGSIKSAVGETMEGVTVSAKAEGSTITTTVFTDETGAYYFPPLEAGKYKVWAQALSFETAKSDVDLAAKKSQDFVLTSITDFETRVRQLPGDLILAGLPEETVSAGGALAIVNRGRTPSDRLADVRIDGGAGETLDAVSTLLRA